MWESFDCRNQAGSKTEDREWEWAQPTSSAPVPSCCQERGGAGAQLISEEKPIIQSVMPPLLIFKYWSNKTPKDRSDSSTASLWMSTWRGLKPEREGSQLPETVCREGDTTGIWEKKILCVNCPNHYRIFSTPEPHLPSTNGLKSCGTRISLSQHVPEHLLLAEPHPLRATKSHSNVNEKVLNIYLQTVIK